MRCQTLPHRHPVRSASPWRGPGWHAAAQFRRFVPADALAWWLPVCWIGFNLALWPAMKLAPRAGALRLVAAAALVAAVASLAGMVAPSMGLLAAARCRPVWPARPCCVWRW
jgi:hypothetical protein